MTQTPRNGTDLAPGSTPAHTRARRLAIAPLLLVIAGLALLSGCTGVDQGNALKVLDHDRNASGLASVHLSSALTPSAQAHAQQMGADGYLFHSQLRLARGECGMGENVGYGGSISAVEQAFMRSAPHRANILNGQYNLVGLGVSRARGLVWVVQLFVISC